MTMIFFYVFSFSLSLILLGISTFQDQKIKYFIWNETLKVESISETYGSHENREPMDGNSVVNGATDICNGHILRCSVNISASCNPQNVFHHANNCSSLAFAEKIFV